MQDNTLIPTTIDVTLLSPVSTSFRCQCAANSLDIDVKKKSTHRLLSIMDCRIMGKFSSVPMYKALKKDDNWILKEERMKLNTQATGGNMKRHINAGFRDRGIKTWTFEFIGNKKQ